MPIKDATQESLDKIAEAGKGMMPGSINKPKLETLNRQRGHVQLILGKEKYNLLPDFNFMVSVTEQLGYDATAALRKLANGILDFRALTVIVYRGIYSYYASKDQEDKCPDPQDVGEKIIRHGMTEIEPLILQFLTLATASDRQLEECERMAKKELSQES